MFRTLIDYIYFIFGIYSLLLILIGTPLNFLCFYVAKYISPTRTNATIIVFSYLALIELLIPFTWNLNYAIRELIWKRQRNIVINNLEEHSLFVCKLVSFGAYFLLQCAAWLKTLATFTRCISLHHEWSIRKYILKPHIAHYLCWMTILLFAFINFPIWIINGERAITIDQYNNTQIQIKCYRSKFFQFWEIVHLLLYNFIPFTLMILCNITIIRHVHASRQRTQGSRMRSQSSTKHSFTRRAPSTDGSRLTKTLILITVFFIIFTSPSAIFYISLGKIIKRHRNLITMVLSSLATTSHVVSFVIYWLTSADFPNSVMSFLYCRPLVSHKSSTDDKPQEKRNLTYSASSTLLVPSTDEYQKPTMLQSPTL